MTEHVREADELYLTALRGQKVSWPMGAVAVPGLYKMRYPGKDSPWCAIKIVERYEIDDETGEQQSDSSFECTVNGRPVAATEVWPYCGRFPITTKDYADMTQMPSISPTQQNATLPYTRSQPDRMQSDDISGLAKALAKAQGEVDGALKDSSNPHFKSAYADLASVWGACRKALSSNGLSVTQTTKASDGTTVTVVTTLLHESGQWLRGELTMRPLKPDPQGIGSCITYARRYALAAMVGVAPEDDDGEGASGRQTKPEPRSVARTDEKLMAATDWANTTAMAIDRCKTGAEVVDILEDPETSAKLKWLQGNHENLFEIVDSARRRKVAKFSAKVPA